MELEIMQEVIGGRVKKQLTDAEIVSLADLGDTRAKKAVLKDEVSKAGNIQAKVDAIIKFLGLS